MHVRVYILYVYNMNVYIYIYIYIYIQHGMNRRGWWVHLRPGPNKLNQWEMLCAPNRQWEKRLIGRSSDVFFCFWRLDRQCWLVQSSRQEQMWIELTVVLGVKVYCISNCMFAVKCIEFAKCQRIKERSWKSGALYLVAVTTTLKFAELALALIKHKLSSDRFTPETNQQRSSVFTEFSPV